MKTVNDREPEHHVLCLFLILVSGAFTVQSVYVALRASSYAHLFSGFAGILTIVMISTCTHPEIAIEFFVGYGYMLLGIASGNFFEQWLTALKRLQKQNRTTLSVGSASVSTGELRISFHDFTTSTIFSDIVQHLSLESLSLQFFAAGVLLIISAMFAKSVYKQTRCPSATPNCCAVFCKRFLFWASYIWLLVGSAITFFFSTLAEDIVLQHSSHWTYHVQPLLWDNLDYAMMGGMACSLVAALLLVSRSTTYMTYHGYFGSTAFLTLTFLFNLGVLVFKLHSGFPITERTLSHYVPSLLTVTWMFLLILLNPYFQMTQIPLQAQNSFDKEKSETTQKTQVPSQLASPRNRGYARHLPFLYNTVAYPPVLVPQGPQYLTQPQAPRDVYVV